MNLRNNVRLIGHLGQDPDIRELSNSRKMARFSVATSETYRNEKGERVKETQWHSLIAWGKQVDVIAKYFKKGGEVAIEGQLHSHSYVDKEGTKRYVTDIVVNDFLMLGNAKKE